MLITEFKDYVLSSNLFTPAIDWPIQYRFDETKFTDKTVLVIREQPSGVNFSNSVVNSYDIYLMGRENTIADTQDLEIKIHALRDFFQSYKSGGLPHTTFNCIINVNVLMEPYLFGETETNRILFKISVSATNSATQIRG